MADRFIFYLFYFSNNKQARSVFCSSKVNAFEISLPCLI